MNDYLVYVHTSPSGKSYVGLTNNYKRRCKEHKITHLSECVNIARAIKKYGWDNFTHTIVDSGLSLDVANELEEFLIEELNTLAPNGYNLTTGGNARIKSPESKAKTSASLMGRVFTAEHKDKIGAVHRGKVLSEITKQRIQDSRKERGAQHGARKEVLIDNILYESQLAAAISLGVSAATIAYRIKSDNYPNYVRI
jgi:group I intron endonuclease